MVLTVAAAVIGILITAYFSDTVEAALPWHTAEGEIPDCGPPVTDVGAFAVQVESIETGADSAVAAAFEDREFCALPPKLRPGADNQFTAVMLDRTHPTHALAFLAACKFADEVRPHAEELRQANTGVRTRRSEGRHEVEWISADGQECRGALPRSIADPAEFVRTYFDEVGNQDRTNELSEWLSEGFLERTSVEDAAEYWQDDVDEVRLVDYSTLDEPPPSSVAATVAIRLCVDETSTPNKPVALQVALVNDTTSWQIDRVEPRPITTDHCDQ